MSYDFAVIGGGILGASTAWQLQRDRPAARVVLVEKEARLATHQSGHNSGVIHAGVYYAPGSLKAQYCRAGAEETVRFCQAHGIAYERCGKLLVATDARQLEWMDALFARARDNAIACERLDEAALREREPNISGCGAIFVAKTGIVDYAEVARRMANLFQAAGGEIKLAREVSGLREERSCVILETTAGEIRARHLVCCAGLLADRLARLSGLALDFRIVPFRGEYYRLPPGRRDLIRHLIYPVPDPQLPFLGIHLTRTIDGSITVGPNAVLALQREGYAPGAFSLGDTAGMLAFPGFWRMALRHLKFGLREMRNALSRSRYLEEVRRFCPQLTLQDLQAHPAGVRAQAVSRAGELIHDFLILSTRRTIHVCNAPSPAATSAIPIGAHIVREIDARFGGGALT